MSRVRDLAVILLVVLALCAVGDLHATSPNSLMGSMERMVLEYGATPQ